MLRERIYDFIVFGAFAGLTKLVNDELAGPEVEVCEQGVAHLHTQRLARVE